MRRAMPKVVVTLSERANRVVLVVKAREGLRGKSAAIERIVQEYEERVFDTGLRPEFVAEVRRIRKGPFRQARSLDEIRSHLEDDPRKGIDQRRARRGARGMDAIRAKMSSHWNGAMEIRRGRDLGR